MIRLGEVQEIYLRLAYRLKLFAQRGSRDLGGNGRSDSRDVPLKEWFQHSIAYLLMPRGDIFRKDLQFERWWTGLICKCESLMLPNYLNGVW